jgi:histidyl-tRNA synthetase
MRRMTPSDRSFDAPKGTRDLLPPESWEWQGVIRLAMDSFAQAGYAPMDTPIFEETAVFERGVGESSEVVNKQMYTFTDKGGRSLTLRPEGTAPTVRAVVQHLVVRGDLPNKPVKLAYAGPMFRQERPQKGRYRQFFQVGIEAIGSDSPLVDAEVIEIGDRFLRDAGVEPALLLNSIGHPAETCRDGYMALLVDYLSEHEDALHPDDRARIHANPLRTFDSKEEKTIAVMENAPKITDHLCAACRAHFEQVQELLASLQVAFTLDHTLVRGLDYYTRTAFEFIGGSLGSQNAVGGGGRYDGLSELLGGPALPGIGFALGLDRIMISRRAKSLSHGVTAYVVALGDEARRAALPLATRLRRAGISADLDLSERGMKGQMKDADRSGARFAVIVGDDELAAGEATVRDLSTREQERYALDDLPGRLSR